MAQWNYSFYQEYAQSTRPIVIQQAKVLEEDEGTLMQV